MKKLLAVAVLLATQPLFALDMGTLHPMQPQGYQLSISGMVRTAGRPSAGAVVRVELRTSINQTVKASTAVQEDGTYALQMNFDEYQSGQLDWKIIVRDRNASETTHEGRRITDGESRIILEKTIELPSNTLQLALR